MPKSTTGVKRTFETEGTHPALVDNSYSNMHQNLRNNLRLRDQGLSLLNQRQWFPSHPSLKELQPPPHQTLRPSQLQIRTKRSQTSVMKPRMIQALHPQVHLPLLSTPFTPFDKLSLLPQSLCRLRVLSNPQHRMYPRCQLIPQTNFTKTICARSTWSRNTRYSRSKC